MISDTGPSRLREKTLDVLISGTTLYIKFLGFTILDMSEDSLSPLDQLYKMFPLSHGSLSVCSQDFYYDPLWRTSWIT